MASFFALLWETRDEAAGTHARIIRERIGLRPEPPVCLQSQPGFELYDLAPGTGARPYLAIEREDGSCAGAVFGTLFARCDDENETAPLTHLPPGQAAGIAESAGKVLIERYWGSYVAFLTLPGGAALLVDPTAAIPCYYSSKGGLLLAFSNLEACDFLDRAALSVNLNFVSALLAYDKILNGETGLSEVRELLGGQRLTWRGGGAQVADLWTPARFAHDRLDARPGQLQAGLAHCVRHVVRSRASAFETVRVSLSGGLDSAIVLACLMHPAPDLHVEAVHFRLASEDTPESAYAAAAAAHAGAPLSEVVTDTLGGFRDLADYPLTARPLRALLAPDPHSLIPPARAGALFTGQGGDHLFRTARSPLGFADFLHNRGAACEAPSLLVETARLSGESIWGVLAATGAALRGRRGPGAMERGIASRRTQVNQRAHEAREIAALLPRWAREPAGLPPGKFDQVSTLMHMIEVRDTLLRPGGGVTVHPLVSQPLIEMALRIPAYRLSAGGISRGLVRNAFAADLPDLIRLRTTKGRATRFYMDHIRSRIGALRSLLDDGELIRSGLVDRRDLSAFMSEANLMREGSATMLLVYSGIECWLRAWKRVQASGRSSL